MRKTFIFHRDRLQYMEEMSADEKLQLYEAITAYSIGHEVVVDGSIKFIRSRIKAEIEKDRDAYAKVCQRNKKTAEKRRKKEKKTTKNTTRTFGIQSYPLDTKNAERDNHNHTDYDNHILSKDNNKENNNLKEIKEKEKEKEKLKKEKEKNGFEEFWGVYPNKQKKLKAKEKYDALIKNGTVSHTALMEGVMRYVTHIRKNNIEPKFIKQPTTRLNNGCREDEYKITLARPPVISKPPPASPTPPVASALTPASEQERTRAKEALSQRREKIKTI